MQLDGPNPHSLGNFGHVLEKAHRLAYKPFLDVLARHPHVKLSLHQSGILYDWMEQAHPEHLEKIAELARAGQIEMVGGGYYEPILALIPEADQKGQVDRMSRYLQSRFGKKPRGFWLAERVWEPQLPKVLEQLGVEYTVVDDTHFSAVGFSEKELSGHFMTDFDGRAVKVFPISQRLRYMIPYAPPERVLEHLLAFGREHAEDVALVMADDGEKFGLWPRTHDHVYTNGWLERFFTLLEERRDQVRTATFSEWLDRSRPRGWAYLPTSSYFELSEWALGPEAGRGLETALHAVPEDQRRFVRGGYFRNFFTKYPEASRLYRKMLRVSRKVHGLKEQAALEELWQGQCNCPYWHGVFGGLYLPHLRGAVYGHLLKAEAAADAKLLNGKRRGDRWFQKDGFSIDLEDWDADGRPEVLAESAAAGWYIAPGQGGGLWEWDIKAAGVNLGGIVSRRREAYHERVKHAVVLSGTDVDGARSIHDLILAKEPGLDKLLNYDWHPRMSLLDHFLHPDTSLASFCEARYGEQGDFVLAPYALVGEPAAKDGRLTLSMKRDGHVWSGDKRVAVRVEKRVVLSREGGWECAVTLTAAETASVWYGMEVALSLTEESVCGFADESEVKGKVLDDPIRGLRINLAADAEGGAWSFPIYTVQQSEEGFEKTYQGAVVLLHRRLALEPGTPRTLTFSAEAARI